jgi:hypothetical protein
LNLNHSFGAVCREFSQAERERERERERRGEREREESHAEPRNEEV